MAKAESEESVHKIVIVGAGIAGLAAALALHRIGIKTLVLERSPELRTSGIALAISGNAWRALDQLGVAESLRMRCMPLTGFKLYKDSGDLLTSMEMNEYPGGPHEQRIVNRRLLAESMASQLPEGTIQLNARVQTIHREPEDKLTKVELEDGSVIFTKVLLGCDGINSAVGKWMGLPTADYRGVHVYRGMAVYPEEHGLSDFSQFIGGNVRVGFGPQTPKTVYWVTTVARASPGPRVDDPDVLKKEVEEAVKYGCPEIVKSLVDHTDQYACTPIYDRIIFPMFSPPVVKDGVTLAGDALHPVQPFLGQGGCLALEDAIMFARTLGVLLSQPGGVDDDKRLQKTLEKYAAERQQRSFLVAFKSFAIGFLLSIKNSPSVYVRDNYVLPKIMGRFFIGHTLYDVGKLHDFIDSPKETKKSK